VRQANFLFHMAFHIQKRKLACRILYNERKYLLYLCGVHPHYSSTKKTVLWNTGCLPVWTCNIAAEWLQYTGSSLSHSVSPHAATTANSWPRGGGGRDERAQQQLLSIYCSIWLKWQKIKTVQWATSVKNCLSYSTVLVKKCPEVME
jgi:hypothetical protein